ncbi:MAG: hypothetical protein ACTTG8_08070 [Catonella sp.]|uniref:ATP-binding protein n=1 Tax=Catonella sp. TaxID=2382125 RepID=UPI003FA1199C
MNDEEFILDRLYDSSSLYLKANKNEIDIKNELPKEITMDFLALYRIDEITFEDKSPRKEALENVISSMSIDGVNFVYIIKGDASGVRFYYGVAQDFSYDGDRILGIAEIGEKIIKPSLQGNFRGSVITEINPNERKKILSSIDSFKEAKILEGVPGINKDDEKFQSVDRVIDVMLGDEFALMLIAKPIIGSNINNIQNSMYHLYNSIAPIGKTSIQESTGKSIGTSESMTKGDSETEGTSSSTSEQEGASYSTSHTKGESSGKSTGTTYNSSNNRVSQGGSEGTNININSSDATSESESKSTSTSTSDSKSISKSTSNTESKQTGKNTGSSTTLEVVNKKVQDWIKYMDDVILPRLDYGLGKGLFITSTVLLGKDPSSLIKIENTLKSIYGGEAGNRMPLKAFKTNSEETRLLKKFQIPMINFRDEINEDELGIRTSCSQFYINPQMALLGNWMSSQEISLIAGLPQKEVVGLALREEVEFGLNINKIMKDPILLGHLVQSGVVLNGENGVSNIPVCFDKAYFDKHIFVTGVTGGGKTTTCQKLLLASRNNFLVIEPAKTEYRVMAEKEFPDMLVFTLGKESGAPFRLNPFEFFEGENITSRVDMIKASMEAAFDMEAAIPQLLEAAIYECYEDKGWNISNNRNYKYSNPFADGTFSFPTLGDLEKKVEKVVREQGFDDRLKDEYIGSIRARLKGLTVGSKGQMLNTPRSIDFVELLDKKVILELEYIKSVSEKSLIMGFILANLSEAIRVKYNNNGKKSINHLTLIEEAHRLLSKYMPGDSMNKKQGVEMFADMLAEVRKYGESLIIVDQIPNKLTPEVLKNTNTKIVHKIFAQDDKEAIGNTMALKDEQKEYLSYLSSGRAIMMMPGLSKAIQVQIEKNTENDTERPPLEDFTLRDRIISYYASVYKRGILPGLEKLEEQPSNKLVSIYLDFLRPTSQFVKKYYNCIHKRKISDVFVEDIIKLKTLYNFKDIVRILCYFSHNSNHLVTNPEIYDYVEELLNEIANQGTSYSIEKYKNYFCLDSTIKKGEC